MKTLFRILSIVVALFVFVPQVHAAYVTRFDAINFDPAVDGGDYFTVYGSQTLKAWQGNLGFYVDYANRPLQFVGTGGTTGRQSVLDHMTVVDLFGAIGFVDWFTAGLNIPVVGYNWFFTDNAAALEDNGPGMGDLRFVTKFRLVDIEKHKVGFSVLPYVTLPTGDIVRYNGNGSVTGGANLIFDVQFHERFNMSLNAGYLMHDDVTRTFVFTGGATSTIRVDDMFTYGVGANFKFSKSFQGIVEATGSTVVRDFFSTSNTMPFEAGGGIRYYFGDSGFAMSLGGAAGLIEGVGTPRFRGFAGLTWTSPVPQPCPECAPPDPRIQGNKIVLWGKIFYDTAKATIKPISYPVLDDVVDVMVKNPHVRLVEVQGHTDWRGSDGYNMGLSDRRAHSAMQYLISKGIDASRLKATGYGETRPIASNDTVEGMSQNRRTEFIILQSDDGSMTQTNGGQTSLNDVPSLMSVPVTQASFTNAMSEKDVEQVSYNDFSEFMSDDTGNL